MDENDDAASPMASPPPPPADGGWPVPEIVGIVGSGALFVFVVFCLFNFGKQCTNAFAKSANALIYMLTTFLKFVLRLACIPYDVLTSRWDRQREERQAEREEKKDERRAKKEEKRERERAKKEKKREQERERKKARKAEKAERRKATRGRRRGFFSFLGGTTGCTTSSALGPLGESAEASVALPLLPGAVKLVLPATDAV